MNGSYGLTSKWSIQHVACILLSCTYTDLFKKALQCENMYECHISLCFLWVFPGTCIFKTTEDPPTSSIESSRWPLVQVTACSTPGDSTEAGRIWKMQTSNQLVGLTSLLLNFLKRSQDTCIYSHICIQLDRALAHAWHVVVDSWWQEYDAPTCLESVLPMGFASFLAVGEESPHLAISHYSISIPLGRCTSATTT